MPAWSGMRRRFLKVRKHPSSKPEGRPSSNHDTSSRPPVSSSAGQNDGTSNPGQLSTIRNKITSGSRRSRISAKSSRPSAKPRITPGTARPISIASSASANSIVSQYNYPELPYGWKEAIESSEKYSFKKIRYIMYDHYPGARLAFLRDDISEPAETWRVKFDHPTRTIFLERYTLADLLNELEKQLRFLEVGKDEPEFRKLYTKLHTKIDKNAVVYFKEGEKHETFKNKKYLLQARYNGNFWTVAHDKKANAINDMIEHLDYTEIRYKPTPNVDMKNLVWTKLKTLMVFYYGGSTSYGGKSKNGRCRLFYKKVQEMEGKSIKKVFYIKLADIREGKMFEYSASTLDEAAIKLEQVMDRYKSEKADLLMCHPIEKPDFYVGANDLQEHAWCKVTQEDREIENGVFKLSLNKIARRKMDVEIYYGRTRSGWLIKVVENRENGLEIAREGGQTLSEAQIKLYHSLDFKEIRPDDNTFRAVYIKLQKKSETARLFLRKDTSNRYFRHNVYILKIYHPTLGFQFIDRTKEKVAEKMSEHLTFKEFPTDREAIASVLRLNINYKLVLLDQILEIMHLFGTARLFYKFQAGSHVFKVDHPIWGIRAEQSGPILEQVLSALLGQMKIAINDEDGQKLLFEVDFMKSSRVFKPDFPDTSAWIPADDKKLDRVFLPLIRELYRYYSRKKDISGYGLYYMKKGLIWRLKIEQKHKHKNETSVLIEEESYDLEYLISSVRYNFDFSEEKYKDEFAVIRNHPSLKNENYQILWKQDFTGLYQYPKWFVVKLVHKLKGFQVSGKTLNQAANKMAEHLYYEKVPKNNATITGRPIWDMIFKEMRWYGDCKIFQKKTIDGVYILKVDHPLWGIQFKKQAKDRDIVEKQLLKVLQTYKGQAHVEFIHDKKTWFRILNQQMEIKADEVHATQYALTSSEDGVFKKLFYYCRRELKEEPTVLYSQHGEIFCVSASLPKKKKKCERKGAHGYETLCNSIIYELGFEVLTIRSMDRCLKKVDKTKIKGLYDLLESKHGRKNAVLSYRKVKKDLIAIDAPVSIPKKGGFVVRVEDKDDKRFKFQTMDEKLEKAIEKMSDIISCEEVTMKNKPTDTQWEHVLNVLRDNYGDSRLFRNQIKNKKDCCVIKVFHNRKGLVHEEKADSYEVALGKMLKKLNDDATAAKTSTVYAFENTANSLSTFKKARLKGILEQKDSEQVKAFLGGVTSKTITTK